MSDSPEDKPSSETCPPITIVTGTRLHFGLLRTETPFGGAGVMLENPDGRIQVRAHESFDCEHRYRERIEPIVDRMVDHFGWDHKPKCRITVPRPFRSHVGLGSGTQLSLGVVHAICAYAGERFDPIEMATSFADRGKRSAVGVHGYAVGGMIIEDGDDGVLNPMIDRIELPADWEVGLLVPSAHEEGVSGIHEQQQFDRLPKATDAQFERLRSLLMNDLAHAAREGDFEQFTTSVTRYNYESGRLFESVQGGPYNGQAVSQLVDHLRSLGAFGVGQSSWGPGVFCWFRSHEEAVGFAKRTLGQIPDLVIAKPKNRGADLMRG